MKEVYVVGYGFLNGGEWVAEGISAVCTSKAMANRLADEITEAGSDTVGYVSGPHPFHVTPLEPFGQVPDYENGYYEING